MKKIISILLLAILCLGLLAGCGKKEETVYVTISDEGALAVSRKEVPLKDIDGDGVASVSDAIASAHEEFYKGGAKEGYVSMDTEYGISIGKLWGVENGGSYGFYLNSAYVDSLANEVKAGDHVYAYSYADLEMWSDVFSYFDKETAKSGEVELTLTYLYYDENWMLQSAPCPNAEITIDGVPSGVFTDDSGKASVSTGSGEHIISAVSDTMTLVPPICVVG